MTRWTAIAGSALLLAGGGALLFFCLRRHAGPDTCATRCADGTRCGEDAAQGFHRVKPPDLPGFHVVHADFDDADAVALATDAQQRTVLMGFDPGTHAVRWTASVAADPRDNPDPARVPHVLVGQKWFAAYGEPGRAQHAVAFDALTGRRLWDRAIEGGRVAAGVRAQDRLLFFAPDDGSAPIVIDERTGQSP